MIICQDPSLTSTDLITIERTMLTYMSRNWPADGLEFDPWKYSRPELLGILLAIFDSTRVIDILGLEPGHMLSFILSIEKLYNPDVPYHSFYHAVDVVVKLFYVLHDINMVAYFTSYDTAALLIAGLCHDAGHPGLNNLYQQNAGTELAEKYKTSILERYSIDLALKNIERHRLFRNIDNRVDPNYMDSTTTEKSIGERLRAQISESILYTDMSRHFELVKQCTHLVNVLTKKAESLIEKHGPRVFFTRSDGVASTSNVMLNQSISADGDDDDGDNNSNSNNDHHNGDDENSARSPQSLLRPRPEQSLSSSHTEQPPASLPGEDHPTRSGNKRIRSLSFPILSSELVLNSVQRQSLINIILHSIDILNPVLPWPMCKRWSNLMVTESFRQGDLERSQGLPITPSMDRHTTDQCTISINFGTIIIKPFFDELVCLFPLEVPLIETLESNLEMWRQMHAERSKESSLAAQPSPLTGAELYPYPYLPALPQDRRLSVAAGTIELPQRLIDCTRRHSSEGFFLLQHYPIGPVFSRHLERFNPRRKFAGQPMQSIASARPWNDNDNNDDAERKLYTFSPSMTAQIEGLGIANNGANDSDGEDVRENSSSNSRPQHRNSHQSHQSGDSTARGSSGNIGYDHANLQSALVTSTASDAGIAPQDDVYNNGSNRHTNYYHYQPNTQQQPSRKERRSTSLDPTLFSTTLPYQYLVRYNCGYSRTLADTNSSNNIVGISENNGGSVTYCSPSQATKTTLTNGHHHHHKKSDLERQSEEREPPSSPDEDR